MKNDTVFWEFWSLKINTNTYNCHRWIPDSPRWLIVKGLKAEAQLILEEGASFNRRVVLAADIPMPATQKWVWRFADFCMNAGRHDAALQCSCHMLTKCSADSHSVCHPATKSTPPTSVFPIFIHLVFFSFFHCFFLLRSAWHPS